MTTIDVLKALLPLILIIGILYASLYFLRKYSFKTKKDVARIIDINVISNKMIMPKKFISVVQVKDKLLVLGISENSVSLLKELDMPENIPQIPESENESFLSMLKKNFGMK